MIESSAMKSNLCLWLMAVGIAAAQTSGTRAFIGARLIDGTGKAAIEHATLIIRNGRVEAVGPSSRIKPPVRAERIDMTGKTIMPGLVNAHGHVADTMGLKAGPEFYTRENLLRQLGLYARYGVTSVFSLGGDKEEAFKLREEQGTLPAAPRPGVSGRHHHRRRYARGRSQDGGHRGRQQARHHQDPRG